MENIIRAANRHGIVKQEECPVARDALEEHFKVQSYELTQFITGYDFRAQLTNNVEVMKLAQQQNVPYVDHFMGAVQSVNELKVYSMLRAGSLR